MYSLFIIHIFLDHLQFALTIYIYIYMCVCVNRQIFWSLQATVFKCPILSFHSTDMKMCSHTLTVTNILSFNRSQTHTDSRLTRKHTPTHKPTATHSFHSSRPLFHLSTRWLWNPQKYTPTLNAAHAELRHRFSDDRPLTHTGWGKPDTVTSAPCSEGSRQDYTAWSSDVPCDSFL